MKQQKRLRNEEEKNAEALKKARAKQSSEEALS